MNDFLKPRLFKCAPSIKHAVLYASDYNVTLYADQKFNELDIPFPELLNNAVIKRKAEYLAGRYTAKKALKKLGVHSKYISTGVNRAPNWPKGIVASITHTDKTAICIAAHSLHFSYLGIDLENILEVDIAHALKRMVIDEKEEQLLRNISDDFPAFFTLAFSAKESVFKALHPYVKRYFDFSAVRLSQVSLGTQRITLTLTEDLCSFFPKDSIVQGSFHIIDQQVMTYIYKRTKG